MKYIKYGAALNVLVAVKGHPFERDAFAAIFEEMEGIGASFVDQPAAAAMMNPEAMAGFDALVLYDMPGLNFLSRRAERPAPVAPPESLRVGLRRLLEVGKGVVALHHAIAGWPAWPEYAEYLGGRFLYRAGSLRGAARPDSGYRHDVCYEAVATDPAHPLFAGLPPRLAFTDEVYLHEVFEDSITPLLRAEHSFTAENFYSAELAVAQGKLFSNEGWQHEPGSNVIAWEKRALASKLVYLQPGDGPATYANPQYRRLVENAIRYVAAP